MPTLRIIHHARAEELRGRDPLALLLGMLFDQHVSRGEGGAPGRSSIAR